MFQFFLSKPVLIGLHLGFAILGIDAFFWFFGELTTKAYHRVRLQIAAIIGLASFAASWVIGGYYYVKFYGTLVKPSIIAGSMPWAHSVAMEAKEHIFLVLIPLAIVAVFASFLPEDFLQSQRIKRNLKFLSGFIILAGFALGVMGFVISAAARWGVIK